MLDVLNGVQEQIRFADTKAAIFAAALVVLFGFMATQVDGLQPVAETERGWHFWTRACLLALYGVSTVVAFTYAARCVMPRTGESAPPCLFHVAHVAKTYRLDHERFCRDMAVMDEGTWVNQDRITNRGQLQHCRREIPARQTGRSLDGGSGRVLVNVAGDINSFSRRVGDHRLGSGCGARATPPVAFVKSAQPWQSA